MITKKIGYVIVSRYNTSEDYIDNHYYYNNEVYLDKEYAKEILREAHLKYEDTKWVIDKRIIIY